MTVKPVKKAARILNMLIHDRQTSDNFSGFSNAFKTDL